MSLMGSDFQEFNKKWALRHAFMNVLGLIVTYHSGSHFVWLLISIVSFVFYLLKLPEFLDASFKSIGLANYATLARLILVFFLFAQFRPLSNVILFWGFLIAILMDGLDGYLARKFQTQSKPGEIFDMETDAFLVLVMSWIHYIEGRVGMWILIPGAMRYSYELLFFWLESNGNYPSKKARATIAVLFFLGLLVPFIFPQEVSLPVLILTGGLIVISFLVSIIRDLKLQFGGNQKE